MKNLKKTLCFLSAVTTLAAFTVGCADNNESSSDSSSSSKITTSSPENEDEKSPDKKPHDKESPAKNENEKVPAAEPPAEAPEALQAAPPNVEKLFSERDKSGEYGEISAEIEFGGDAAKVGGTGASADGSAVTITEEGVYKVTGKTSDGQIVVNAPKGKVQIVLENADITCKTAPAIYVADADKVFLTLPEGTKNSLSDGENYAETSDDDDEKAVPVAAIFSEDSLTINGKGELTVKGCSGDGIRSKDDIVITGGTLTVTAENDGIKGKDYIAAADATVKITAGEDGLKSTNKTDSSLGFIYIESGNFDIVSDQDGIQAETVFYASGGTFNIVSGGGNENSTKEHNDDFGGRPGKFPGGGGGGRPDFGGDGDEKKPDKGDGNSKPGRFPGGNGGFGGGGNFDFGDFDPSKLPEGMPNGGDFDFGDFDPSKLPEGMPNGGDFDFGDFDPSKLPEDNKPETPDNSQENTSGSDDSSDISTKGIKGCTGVSISGGNFTVDAADDAVHSNVQINISGGELSLASGNKGIKANSAVDINGGTVNVTKSYEGIESAIITISGGDTKVYASDDGLNASDGSQQGPMGSYSAAVQINVTGGELYVNADGDGIDSNGDMTISGGKVLVDGPENGANGALDSNGKITVTGGVLVAVGSAGMAESPDESSTQHSVVERLDKTASAGTVVTLVDGDGNEIFSYTPAKTFSHVVISTPDLDPDKEYKVITK